MIGRISALCAKSAGPRNLPTAICLCSCSPENRYSIRSHNCGQLSLQHVGQSVKLCGWLKHKRLPKFLVLGDTYGSVQIFNGSKDKQLNSALRNVNCESVLQLEGRVLARPEKDRNPNSPTGDIEVHMDHMTVLNSAKCPLPVDVHDFVTPNLLPRMKYRYLDLRRPSMQKMLRFRAEIVSKMRAFLEKHSFVEVETPTLFRRTPGGAQEFVVPSSTEPGKFYSLPQSPQQFKQLLMVAGLDRYFQIARCYRDESSKSDRQPEFTQLDIELSFTDQEKVMLLVEDVVKASWPAEISAKYSTPSFQRMTYQRCMQDYGIDKPDLRYDWRIHRTVLRSVSGSATDPLKTTSSVTVSRTEPSSNISGEEPLTWAVNGTSDSLTVPNTAIDVQKFAFAEPPRAVIPHETLYILPIPCAPETLDTETLQRWAAKFRTFYANWAKNFTCYKRLSDGTFTDTFGLRKIDLADLTFEDSQSAADIQECNVFFGISVRDRSEITDALKTLGLLRIWVADHLEANGLTVRRDEMNFLWVTDFPLFLQRQREITDLNGSALGTVSVEPQPQGTWESAHHPFTAAHPDQSIMDSDGVVSNFGKSPGDLIAQHYDLVLNGTELGGGSVRIHDSATQRYVLGEILGENCDEMRHLLEAFTLGAPPHAGFALGLDRYIALLLKTESIRDVVAFPKISDGKDLMTQAPSGLSKETLKRYHITISVPPEKRPKAEISCDMEDSATKLSVAVSA